MIRTKLLVEHRPDCFALQAAIDGEWGSPWAWLEKVEHRIANGNKAPKARPSSGGRWWWLRCNDPSCPAEIVVNEDDLLTAIHQEADILNALDSEGVE